MKKPTCEEQLQTLQQEFDEFAYIVSHDLKAPLRAICNLSGWIGEDLGSNLEPDVQHNLNLLQNRAERMERMVNALLLYSRVPRYDLQVKQTDLTHLVQTLAASLQQQQPFTLHLSPLPVLTTYAKKLETVLGHLLQNAVIFNDSAQPQVWVEANTTADEVHFTVRDNGTGISEEAKEKIFKMFYTAQTKDEQQSLGFGLAISKKIVQFVGGTIEVTTPKEGGTALLFTWPAHVPPQ